MDMKGIERLLWGDVYHAVKKVNPGLAKIINQISPSNKYHLYKVSYPFGETIIKDGVFYLPTHTGKTKPISDEYFDDQIRHELVGEKESVPLGVVLNNSYELFIKNKNEVLPVLTTSPGSVFALWRKLDSVPFYHPSKLFNAVAGARNMFMLPNVGDSLYHENLVKKFRVDKFAPKQVDDQWKIFKGIADNVQSTWRTEVIFFASNWIDRIKKDNAWSELHKLFLNNAWSASSYERNQGFYEYALYRLFRDLNRNPSAYIMDTIKHLVSIILGAAPGFEPAVDDSMGPISLFQEAYLENYQISYTPTIMVPKHFNFTNPTSDPVYYFLQKPTNLRVALRCNSKSVLEDARFLKYMIDTIKKRETYIKDNILGAITSAVDFNFYHGKADQQGIVDLAAKIPSLDPRFLVSPSFKRKANFCHTSHLLKGVVQIIHK